MPEQEHTETKHPPTMDSRAKVHKIETVTPDYKKHELHGDQIETSEGEFGHVDTEEGESRRVVEALTISIQDAPEWVFAGVAHPQSLWYVDTEWAETEMKATALDRGPNGCVTIDLMEAETPPRCAGLRFEPDTELQET